MIFLNKKVNKNANLQSPRVKKRTVIKSLHFVARQLFGFVQDFLDFVPLNDFPFFVQLIFRKDALAFHPLLEAFFESEIEKFQISVGLENTEVGDTFMAL